MEASLDDAPGGFLRLDDDGVILEANRTLRKWLAYGTDDDLRGRRFDTILTVSSRVFYQTHFYPLLRLESEVNEVYLSLRPRHGDELPVLVNGVRKETSKGFVNDCILFPIHRRDEYEERILQAQRVAEEAVRVRDDFLAMVSHELRTPLNGIVGWASLLRRGNLNPETIRLAAETIDQCAEVQTKLIDDLLDASQIKSGHFRVEFSDLDLPGTLRRAVEILRPIAAAKDLEIRLRIEGDSVAYRGDEHRLRQAFWNLISNAIKFTSSAGHVDVCLDQTDSAIQISVTDAGEGIAPELLPHIFDMFRQRDTISSQPHGGLGLGLAITRKIVELHGGKVWVENNQQQSGSTFVVQLPL